MPAEVTVFDGGNYLSQVEKVWLVGNSLASVNHFGFMSISLLAVRLVSLKLRVVIYS